MTYKEMAATTFLNKAKALMALVELNEGRGQNFRLAQRPWAMNGKDRHRYAVTLRPPYGYVFSQTKQHAIELPEVLVLEGIAETLKEAGTLQIEACPSGRDCLVTGCMRAKDVHLSRLKKDSLRRRQQLKCCVCGGPIVGAKSTRMTACSEMCRRERTNAAMRLRSRGSEQRSEWEKAYRRKNREQYRVDKKARYERNRERVLAEMKAYYAANRERLLAQRKRKAAQLLTLTNGGTS